MDLRAKHQAEQKELDARIQVLRKTVNSNDKKKKKDVASEIDAMKKELQSRQAQELLVCPAVSHITDQLKTTKIVENQSDGFKYEIREISKAQKRKEKKQQTERDRQQRVQQEDVTSLTEPRTREKEKLAQICSSRGLRVNEIPSDGDCLYNSIKHQLSMSGMDATVTELRAAAADYMRCHADDFRPFISTSDGDLMTDSQFADYCDSVEKTKDWGGHLELRALSEALGRSVEVVQADGPSIELGSQFSDKSALLLSYHRHAYSLGEHYNSLVRN